MPTCRTTNRPCLSRRDGRAGAGGEGGRSEGITGCARRAAAAVAMTMVTAAGPAGHAALLPQLSRVTVFVRPETTAVIATVRAPVPADAGGSPDAERAARQAQAASKGRALDEAASGRTGGAWRITIVNYPVDFYRQLLAQTGDANVGVRLLERRKDRLVIELRTYDPDRVVFAELAQMPPRLLIDVGPVAMVSERIADMEPPHVLARISLQSIEPVLPDEEYPRAPLVVPGAKDYNNARGLLRLSDLNGADTAITNYLMAHGDERLASPARYMHGDIQHRLARGALIRDSLRAARVLEEALQRDPASPYALRARLMVAQDLAMAGMQADAAAKFSDTTGVPEDGELGYAFRLGGAALAANVGDTRGARELMRPLWRDGVPAGIAALARFIEGGILYAEGACDRVVPMLAAAIRLDQRVSDRYPETDLMLAECLTQSERFREATDLYDAVVRRDPPTDLLPIARARQGDLLYYQGDVDGARTDWVAVIGKYPAGEAQTMARLRLALDRRTRPEVARSILDESSQAVGRFAHEARYRRAVHMLRRGEWLPAIRAAETVINSEDAKPFHSRARALRHWAVYQLFAGHFAKADDEAMASDYLRMRRWLRTHPAALRLHRAVAISLEALHLPDEVVKALQAALGRYEGTSGEKALLMDLAEAYIRADDGFRAGRIVTYLREYVMPDVENLRLAEVKARAIASTDRIDEAVIAFELALTLAKETKDRIRLLAYLGEALSVAGRHANAAAAFRRCLKLDSGKSLLRAAHTPLADCRFGLADALFRLGDWRAAGDALATAADMHPQDLRRTTARARAGLAYRRAHKLDASLAQLNQLKDAAAAAAAAAGLDPDGIATPGVATGVTAEFWNRVADRAAEDTRWDAERAEEFQTLMETHE